MRQLTEAEKSKLELLTQNSVELTLIEPTQTGLEKSIMDATGPVRTYLKSKEIHDYSLQQQGPDHKILVGSYLIKEGSLVESVASLYRPQTKKGDPRIWFKGLLNYCDPNDILAIIEFDKKLYVLNITSIDIKALLESHLVNPLKELINAISGISYGIANELLGLLREISNRGPIPALLNADTAVGRTLEALLKININSSKKPDYKGIELKSYREKRSNRKTLFAQVPDWESSKFKSSSEILNNFGYKRGDDFKLYCTVSSIVKNSQGLKLKLDGRLSQLIENSDKSEIGDFVVWALETLHTRLLQKHNETFWISAESTFIEGIEHFHYKKVEYTKKPIVSQFDILLDQGIITLDHLIKRTIKGKVVEKGPLFKIRPKCVGLLFPPSEVHYLT